jgi:Na+/proline symporter
MVNASKHDIPRTSLSSKISSHKSFRIMKWLVIVVLLVLLLLALFLPDRGLAILNAP